MRRSARSSQSRNGAVARRCEAKVKGPTEAAAASAAPGIDRSCVMHDVGRKDVEEGVGSDRRTRRVGTEENEDLLGLGLFWDGGGRVG